MANPIGQLVVELTFDGSKFSQGMNSAKRELQSYGKAIRTSTRHTEKMGYSTQSARVALNNLKTGYEGINRIIDKHRTIMAKLEEQGKGDTEEYQQRAREINNLKAQQYAYAESYEQIARKTAIANSGFTKFGNFLTNTGTRIQAMGQNITALGDGLGQIGTIATVGATLFSKSAIDFERGMLNVQKTTNASADQMKVFEREIRQMATTMPIAHDELTQLASIAGQLGVKQDEIAGFTRTMAILGTATSMSASEASEALARFTNITGTGTSTIDNLGSAIVHLGNNMSTTESEIMHMAQQLAGTLTTVGVGESDILALSASMSSLGITAERGASAISKFFVNMSGSVAEGGEKLHQFAEVAGMTDDKFKTLFKQDAMGAFSSFIDGLAEIDAQGGDVIQTLDDMGITEVRLRDTLLRLAQGHDKLAEATRLSNDAYKDGSKHIKEYELMASSTASQWEIAKNKFKDVAISIGQSLLPAIIDVLNQSDGLVDMAKGFADWFGNLDDGLKQNIVKFGALATVLSPVISGFGSLITVFGGAVRGIGALSKGLGTLHGLSKLAKFGTIGSDLTTMAGGASKATGAVGLLGRAFGLLTNPIGLTVAGLAVVSGAFLYLTRDAREARRAIEDFPTIDGISVEQANSLRKMSDEVAGLNTELDLLGKGADFSSLNENFRGIGEEIESLNNDRIEKLKESFANLPKSIQDSLQDSLAETVQNIEDQTNRVQEAMDRMDEIQAKRDPAGKLPENLLLEAQGLTKEIMQQYAMALGETAEQSNQIYKTLTANHKDMLDEQLVDRRNYVTDAMASEDELFKGQLESLRQFSQEAGLSLEEYTDLEQKITRNHNNRIKELRRDWVKTAHELAKRSTEEMGQSFEKGSRRYEMFLEAMMKNTKMTRDEIEAILAETDTTSFIDKLEGDTLTAFNKLLGVMNDFELDFGEINTENIDLFIDKVRQAGLTWNDLELLSKDANIDDNTKELVNHILETQDKWDWLTFDEKIAEIGVNPAGKAQFEEMLTKLNVDWNQLDLEVKELIANGDTAEQAFQKVFPKLIDWNALSLEEKQIMVDSAIANDEIRSAIRLTDEWNSTEALSKFLEVLTNTDDAETDINNLLTSWGVVPSGESKTLKTETNASETKGTLDDLLGFWVFSLLSGIMGGAKLKTSTNAPETQSKLESAKGSADELDAMSPDVSTSTNASETTAELENTTASAQELGAQRPNIPVQATDRFSNIFASAWAQHNRLNGYTSNSYHYVNIRQRGSSKYLKTGTNYHHGGFAVLGDGGKREPFLTPHGTFGLSPNVDTLYNLPMGTKVWSSINKFRSEASGKDYLKQFLSQLPHFAKGTDHSFLDKVAIPKGFDNPVKNEDNSTVVNMNIDLQVVGNSISRSQADNIIQPIIEAGERYSKKKGTRVNLGGIA